MNFVCPAADTGKKHTHGVVQSSAQQGVVADALCQKQQVVAAGDEKAQKGEWHGGVQSADQGMGLHVVHLHQWQAVLRRQRSSLHNAHLICEVSIQCCRIGLGCLSCQSNAYKPRKCSE